MLRGDTIFHMQIQKEKHAGRDDVILSPLVDTESFYNSIFQRICVI